MRYGWDSDFLSLLSGHLSVSLYSIASRSYPIHYKVKRTTKVHADSVRAEVLGCPGPMRFLDARGRTKYYTFFRYLPKTSSNSSPKISHVFFNKLGHLMPPGSTRSPLKT